MFCKDIIIVFIFIGRIWHSTGKLRGEVCSSIYRIMVLFHHDYSCLGLESTLWLTSLKTYCLVPGEPSVAAGLVMVSMLAMRQAARQRRGRGKRLP